MEIPFELQIALRYLLAKRKQAFISVISAISILGVTVGVMALVIALALMTGLQQEVRDRILGSNPHMFVWKTERHHRLRGRSAQTLRQVPDVIGAAPAHPRPALITSGTSEAFISLKGIDPALEPSVTDIASAPCAAARIEALTAADGDDAERDPARHRSGRAARRGGRRFGADLLTPQGTLSPMGMMPRPRRLRVGGVFNLGLYEFDSQWGFVSLDVAKRLLDKDQHRLHPAARARHVRGAARSPRRSRRTLGADYVVQDWTDMNRSLFSALSLEKMAISLTIGLIVMVAALNIVASLILLVMEKHRDIAILKTMGASARSVTIIFMVQGLIIGMVGTVVGATARVPDFVDRRSLSADSAFRWTSIRCRTCRSRCCRSISRWSSSGGRGGLLLRDDLSVAAGGAARSGAGAAL